jgi:hypothetical protein
MVTNANAERPYLRKSTLSRNYFETLALDSYLLLQMHLSWTYGEMDVKLGYSCALVYIPGRTADFRPQVRPVVMSNGPSYLFVFACNTSVRHPVEIHYNRRNSTGQISRRTCKAKKHILCSDRFHDKLYSVPSKPYLLI